MVYLITASVPFQLLTVSWLPETARGETEEMLLNRYGFLVGDGGEVLEMESGDRRTIMNFLSVFLSVCMF